MKSVAIILNTPNEIADIQETDVICADGGYKHFLGNPIAVIGDFDSEDKIPSGVNIVKYPTIKNETDSQLCIDYAKEHGYTNIVIYGALGGRIDHIFGNVGLLLYAKSLGLNAIIREKDLEISLCNNDFTKEVNVGDTISFVALSDSLVESSKGLFYPLTNLPLSLLTNRSISNIATDKKICLKIKSGTLLCIWYNKL